ncbi:MAG: homoserine dehydrogenase [Flexilinea sp.]
MKRVKVGIIGFGNVGLGFVKVLIEKNEFYQKEFGISFLITAVVDLNKGCAYNPEGIPLDDLLEFSSLNEIPNAVHPNWNAITLIHNAETDAIVELSYTNLKTGEPAVLHVREAILCGKHVVTSNKGPIALQYRSLNMLARENNVKLGIEGTVMSGTPALRLGTDILYSAGITAIQGIFNGTTNFILNEMENGSTYDEALSLAQEFGYAEADPSGDVEGFDTAGKVAILSQLIFGETIAPSDIEREGITDITAEDIAAAKKANSRWKLIGSVKKVDRKIITSVKPEMIPMENPLANVTGATNAIQYETDLLGPVFLIGPGAGRLETGFAIVEDLIAIFQ